MVGDKPAEIVEEFTYLGPILSNDGSILKDLMHRIAKASAVVGRLSAFWRKTSISCRTKMRIYNALVRSVLLYRDKTWLATQSVLRTVNIAQTKHLRRIEGQPWHDFVSNENLLALTAQTPFLVQLAQRTLRWYGHLLRMSPDTPARTIFYFDPVLHGGKRPRVCSPARWKETIGAFLVMANIQGDVHILARDKSKWRHHVASLSTLEAFRQEHKVKSSVMKPDLFIKIFN
ncbi:uncharacterized protein LOC136029660 [Artemia franciscana]|uniref:uncharacterized protein LOC136029660 n=1 Tax=Artemia franciscana TaxID=6661 RepID=UPI0032DA018F